MLMNGWPILSKWSERPLAKVASFRLKLLCIHSKRTLHQTNLAQFLWNWHHKYSIPISNSQKNWMKFFALKFFFIENCETLLVSFLCSSISKIGVVKIRCNVSYRNKLICTKTTGYFKLQNTLLQKNYKKKTRGYSSLRGWKFVL